MHSHKFQIKEEYAQTKKNGSHQTKLYSHKSVQKTQNTQQVMIEDAFLTICFKKQENYEF